MFKNLFLLILASAAVVGCGQEKDGIPFIAPQGSKPADQNIETTTNNYVSGLSSSVLNSSSSRAIRRETIGLNIDITYKNSQKSKADIVVTVSMEESAETCSQAIYRSTDVSVSSLVRSKVTIEDFGEAQCLRYNSSTQKCDYLYVTITKTPSSVISNSGLVVAAVPVVMQNIAQAANVERFIPAISSNNRVLQVPEHKTDFQYCLDPIQTYQAAVDVQYVVDSSIVFDPEETYDTPYIYLGNGFF